MAHASKKRKKPDEAVQDVLCQYFVKKGRVKVDNLCASRLRQDPVFRGFLCEERCIKQRHKGLNSLIDSTVRAMQLGEYIVQDGESFFLQQKPTVLLRRYRPKRGGSAPKTVKRNHKSNRQQRREFHRGPLVQT